MLLFDKKAYYMKLILIIFIILINPLFAKEKKLILAEGEGWFSHMARNMVPNHKYIEKLPFSGFTVVGNSYTNLVMKKGEKLSYNDIWNELKGMKNLYKNKEIFLQVNIHFPADYWDNKAWEQVSKNFALVAQVAKDLGAKGIVFDDEPYSTEAQKMLNFKFPSKKEIKKNPKKFTQWEKDGAEWAWVDENAYRNPRYTFKEHVSKVTLRFKDIMSRMVKAYPNLTMLVYLGPSLSHENSNKNYPIIINMGLPREHELHGAIFTGLKQGLGKNASLHDMGESYKYRKNKHFGFAYQWRKYDIAQDKYNNDLNPNHQWIVPKSERANWANEVGVGFMVYNIPQKSDYPEYNTMHTSSMQDIGNTIKKALHYSDEYVIYYCHKQDWLYPNHKFPLPKGWMKMMQEIYAKK